MQRIVFENDEGGVSIVIPAPKALLDMTIEQIAAGAVPAGKAWRIVATDEVPSDRTFRNAWKPDLTVDMAKAREIKKNLIRAERTALFTTNDLAVQDALISQDKAALDKAVAVRDALRDATMDPAIDAAQTPEELKAVRPAALDTKADAVIKETKP